MANQPNGVDKLAEITTHGLLEKKAHNIVKIDLRELTSSVTDIMLICHGDSDRQVTAIADSVVDEVKKALGENPFSKEGYQMGEWVLIDYVNVVVHVFKRDIREYYSIEDLWADGKTQVITED